MIELIQQTNYFLALGGVVAIFATVLIFIDFFTSQKLKLLIQKWGMYVILLTVSFSITFTLVYSEYFGIEPCGLCWFERMALFPQLIMVLIAIWFKDASAARYGIGLSSFGLVVALYHHYIQMGGTALIRCPTTGAGVECAKRFMFEFNFMTFPLLAATLFAFLIAMYVYILKTKTSITLVS